MKTSNFQMENPSLKKVVFQLNDKYESPNYGIELVMSDAKDIARLSENSAYVSYAVRIFESDLKPDMPFFVEVVYGAKFKWLDIENTELEVLLSQNAPAILLGYIRPLISQLTGNSGFPPLYLPILNYQKNKE